MNDLLEDCDWQNYENYFSKEVEEGKTVINKVQNTKCENLLNHSFSVNDNFILNSSQTNTLNEEKIVQSGDPLVVKPSAEKSNLKLIDPPDITQILELGESEIYPTAHNVSVLNAACQKILKQMERSLLYLLKKNRKGQEAVMDYLMSNEKYQNKNFEQHKKSIKKNRKDQEAIMDYLKPNEKYQNKNFEQYKKNIIKSLCIPFFKDDNGFTPPPNQEVIKKRKLNKPLSVDFIYISHSWTNKDSQTLEKAVIKEGKVETNTAINPDLIDWMKISATYMDGKFSPSECKSKWLMNLSSDVNKSSWKSKETKNLQLIAKKFKQQNWDKIAGELGTKRTGFQCCVQYQSIKAPKCDKWSKEEDEALLQVIKEFQVKDHIPWKKVTWNFEQRSLKQCQERYSYHLQNIKKGFFSPKEDYVLIYLFSKLKSFKKVAKFFPNRVAPQIRARYEYLVISTMPEFSKEEDKLLMQLVMKYSRNWGKISEHFENRSKLQCRKRWAAIQKEMPFPVEISSESDNDSVDDIPHNSDNYKEDKIDIDKNFMHQTLKLLLDKKRRKKKKIFEEYDKLMDHCKFGYKFLFGPKPRLPVSENEKLQFCYRTKIALQTLEIPYVDSLKTFDVSLLSNNCEFDSEDLLVLNEIKNAKENNQEEERLYHKIIPPNYITLIGLRNLLLGQSYINQISDHYKNNFHSKVLDENNRILFSDAKKLFKSRMKTLFAFPLILSNISQKGIEMPNVSKKKIKKVKPLSQRKRKMHGKMMQSFRRNSPKKIETAFNQTFAYSDDLDEMVESGEESENFKSKNINIKKYERSEASGSAPIKRKRGRPQKNVTGKVIDGPSSPKKRLTTEPAPIEDVLSNLIQEP